jgi:3-vinyl bacteriochlorophyllide hydratase
MSAFASYRCPAESCGALVQGLLTTHQLMLLALSAYLAYLINATQFLLKLRAARLQQQRQASFNRVVA